MAESWTRISRFNKGAIGIVTRIILAMITAPLLIPLYLLCWIRFKLTALIYSNNTTSLLSSGDVIPVLDIDHAHGIINVVILTRGNFSLDAMKELFLNKVLKANDTHNSPVFPKFTQYIKLCAGYLMWSKESSFNIDDHIRSYPDRPPNDEEQLKMLITDLCNNPLPSLKSNWEIIVIPLEYSQRDVPQTCILFRVHHFITDGISICRLIIEQMAGNHGAIQQVLKGLHEKSKPKFKNPFLNILSNLGRIIYHYIFNPPLISKDRVNQVFMKSERKCCELSQSGYMDWSSAIKMDTIKRIRDATSASVNDVIVSCMAGAFRKYFETNDISPPDFLKTVIPFSYHGPDDPVRMVNKAYGMLTVMATGDMDCLQRLKATKVAMDQLKCSPEAMCSRWFAQYCVHPIPYKMIRKMDEYFHVNVLLSNVPGPTGKAALNGHMIESLVAFQLPPRQLAFLVSVFTYLDDVTVAVTVDKARVSSREDLRQLLDDFVEEVQQLYNSVVGSPLKPLPTDMEKKVH